jgi:hypothetical protein
MFRGNAFFCAHRPRKVIVVDEARSDADYKNEPLVQSGHVQVFCEKDMYQAERRLAEGACYAANYVLDVPPTFLHMGRGLVEILLQGPDAKQCRQLAVAPRYQIADDYGGVGFLFLITHLVWTFWSLINRWRSYRGTYVVIKRITREVNTATITDDKPAAWRKMDGAWFGAVSKVRMVSPSFFDVSINTVAVKVSGINNFMYMMTRERTGAWRWIFMFIYVRLATFPWWGIIRDPTQWRTLFPVPLIIFWIGQWLVALLIANQYYPHLPHAMFHALMMPMAAVPWFLLCIYAKLFWRGYQGTRPEIQLPNFELPTLPAFGVPQEGPTPPTPPPTEAAPAPPREKGD